MFGLTVNILELHSFQRPALSLRGDTDGCVLEIDLRAWEKIGLKGCVARVRTVYLCVRRRCCCCCAALKFGSETPLVPFSCGKLTLKSFASHIVYTKATMVSRVKA